MWLVEGLACQFEVPQPRGKRLAVNQMRLADIRDAFRVGRHEKDLPDSRIGQAFALGPLVSVRRLVSDPELFTRPNRDILAHYAQAWALTFFLHRTNAKAFWNYLGAISKREIGEVVSADNELRKFAAAFGTPDHEFDLRWAAFLLRLRYDSAKGGR